MTARLTDEERAMQLLEQFQHDLLALINHGPYRAMPHLVAAGLLELTGLVMRHALAREPAELPILLDQIDRLREHVQSAVGSEEPPPMLH